MANAVEIIDDFMTDAKVRRFATDMARESIEKLGNDKKAAENIKKNLEKVFNGSWCCILGSSHTHYVTYFKSNYILLKIGEV